MPPLKRLIVNNYLDYDYSHETLLYSISFSHLRCITLPYCSYAQLRQILSLALKLTSLNISLTISDCTGIDYFAEQHQEAPLSITHLTMSIHTFTRTISRLLFERFLSRTPHLRQLELIVSSGGSNNLLEGKQWEIFIKTHLPFLLTFNFKFKMINIDRNSHNEQNILDQFRTPFWLNRNYPWYVSYNINESILYTVPHFTPHAIKHSLFSILPHSTTLPMEKYFIYYNQINELDLDSNCKSSHRYTYVQRLILSISSIDENIIDVSRVKYLCINTSTWSLKRLFQMIKKSMTCLYHLKIDCNFSLTLSHDIYPLEQIRVLDLPHFSCSEKNNKIEISSLFPYVERLTIKINNFYQMAYLIDQCMHLSSGSFNISNDQSDISHSLTDSDMIRKWLIQKTNRLMRNNDFTCRLSSQSGIWIHLWVSSENISLKKVQYN